MDQVLGGSLAQHQICTGNEKHAGCPFLERLVHGFARIHNREPSVSEVRAFRGPNEYNQGGRPAGETIA